MLSCDSTHREMVSGTSIKSDVRTRLGWRFKRGRGRFEGTYSRTRTRWTDYKLRTYKRKWRRTGSEPVQWQLSQRCRQGTTPDNIESIECQVELRLEKTPVSLIVLRNTKPKWRLECVNWHVSVKNIDSDVGLTCHWNRLCRKWRQSLIKSAVYFRDTWRSPFISEVLLYLFSAYQLVTTTYLEPRSRFSTVIFTSTTTTV